MAHKDAFSFLPLPAWPRKNCTAFGALTSTYKSITACIANRGYEGQFSEMDSCCCLLRQTPCRDVVASHQLARLIAP